MQGSSYDNIFIDATNLNLCSNEELKQQLQYVALSRTRKDAFIYQK